MLPAPFHSIGYVNVNWVFNSFLNKCLFGHFVFSNVNV